MEKLIGAVDKEKPTSGNTPHSGNTKLLAHILDLAFNAIPRDPANPRYRQGGTLGRGRQHWFRGKTGNGRYRLFYRYQGSARIIVYVWINDEQSLRTRDSSRDAYAVFARMLDKNDPPDDWDSLVKAASGRKELARTQSIRKRAK